MSNFLTCSQGLLRSGPAHFSRLIFSPFPLPGPKAILWLYWTQLYHILSHFPDITQESLLPSTPPHAWLILNNYLNLLLDITPSKKSSLMSHVWLWCLHNVHPPYPLPLLCWVCAVPPPPGCRRCESKDCTHLMGGQNLCPQKAGCQESPEEGWFVYSFWYFSDSSSPARKSGIMDYPLRCSSYICRCSSREKRSPVVSLPGLSCSVCWAGFLPQWEAPTGEGGVKDGKASLLALMQCSDSSCAPLHLQLLHGPIPSGFGQHVFLTPQP